MEMPHSYSRVDWVKVIRHIERHLVTAYCYSTVDILIDTWNKWLENCQLDVIPKRTKPRASLPPWITPDTSKIIRKLKSFEHKQLVSFSLKRAQKIIELSSNAKTQAVTDQTLHDEDVFKTRKFYQIYRYFKKIRCPLKTPHIMYPQNVSVESDLDKATKFNISFASVYNETREPGDPFPLAFSPRPVWCQTCPFQLNQSRKFRLSSTLTSR